MVDIDRHFVLAFVRCRYDTGKVKGRDWDGGKDEESRNSSASKIMEF